MTWKKGAANLSGHTISTVPKEYVFGFSNPENLAKIARYHVRSSGPAAIQGRGQDNVGQWRVIPLWMIQMIPNQICVDIFDDMSGANLTAMLGKRGHEVIHLRFCRGAMGCTFSSQRVPEKS